MLLPLNGSDVVLKAAALCGLTYLPVLMSVLPRQSAALVMRRSRVPAPHCFWLSLGSFWKFSFLHFGDLHLAYKFFCFTVCYRWHILL